MDRFKVKVDLLAVALVVTLSKPITPAMSLSSTNLADKSTLAVVVVVMVEAVVLAAKAVLVAPEAVVNTSTALGLVP